MIQELFTEELFIPSLSAETKNQAIEAMVAKLDKAGILSDKAAYLQAVLDREAEYSTGIGMGIAIPHGKSDGVRKPSLVFARSKDGVDFESMDEKPVYLLFLIAVPQDSSDTHLKILSSLSRKLMHQDVRDALINVDSYKEIVKILEL